MKSISLLFLLFVNIALLLLAHGQPSEKIPVLVLLLPQTFFVERIGDPFVDVSVLIAPGHSPATFEPTAKQMETVSKAKLYFQIGVPFEKTALKSLQAANPKMTVIPMHEPVKAHLSDGHDPHPVFLDHPGQDLLGACPLLLGRVWIDGRAL